MFFKKKTVADILGVFNKTVEELYAHAAEKDAEATFKRAASEELIATSNELEAEAVAHVDEAALAIKKAEQIKAVFKD